MNYKVNWSCSDGAFAVPDSAVDNIKLASGKAAKVLFYIMRYKTAATENAADIAAQLDKNMTAEDVEDSLSFWEQLLRLLQKLLFRLKIYSHHRSLHLRSSLQFLPKKPLKKR